MCRRTTTWFGTCWRTRLTSPSRRRTGLRFCTKPRAAPTTTSVDTAPQGWVQTTSVMRHVRIKPVQDRHWKRYLYLSVSTDLHGRITHPNVSQNLDTHQVDVSYLKGNSRSAPSSASPVEELSSDLLIFRQMLKLLLEMDTSHVLDVNAATRAGLTPLHVAVKELWRCQDVALFETLLKAGADVRIHAFTRVHGHTHARAFKINFRRNDFQDRFSVTSAGQTKRYVGLRPVFRPGVCSTWRHVVAQLLTSRCVDSDERSRRGRLHADPRPVRRRGPRRRNPNSGAQDDARHR